MCCGANRATSFQTRAASRASSAAQAPRLPGAGQRSAVAYFEYTGKTAMTAVGPVSGVRYRFAGPGSRLAVDLRDRERLAGIPGLAQVRGL
jgi:hypothetical protein